MSTRSSAPIKMVTYGITVLVVGGVFFVFWLLSPTFFMAYIVPILVFMSIAFVGIMAIVIGSSGKKGKRH